MYKKAYGIIETLAPLHVGASAGEESGNLNLIFRDQFTQTGIIPGSSIRGRFRADMRQDPRPKNEDYKGYNYWYGQEAPEKGESDENKKDTTEAQVKFEYASIVWLPVYCPNQPVVWVSCPRLLNRYQKLSGKSKPDHTIQSHTYYGAKDTITKLFFNLGFIRLDSSDKKLADYIPDKLENLKAGRDLVLVVSDTEISMIHDMALYRQSRVALDRIEKKATGGAFFNVEALPEGTILTFPTAIKNKGKNDNSWQEYIADADIKKTKELYFGGLESIGFGRTNVTLYEGNIKE
jgi:CRISPR-associated protein Cmr4